MKKIILLTSMITMTSVANAQTEYYFSTKNGLKIVEAPAFEEAKICCLVAEKNCGIYLDLLASGRFNEIPEEFVKAGRNYFLYKYGKS